MQPRAIATNLLMFVAVAAGCPVPGQAAQADLHTRFQTRAQALFHGNAVG